MIFLFQKRPFKKLLEGFHIYIYSPTKVQSKYLKRLRAKKTEEEKKYNNNNNKKK